MTEIDRFTNRRVRTVVLAAVCTLALSGSACKVSVGASPETGISTSASSTGASDPGAPEIQVTTEQVLGELGGLAVKGRAPKTGYEREKFGSAWSVVVDACDTRNRVLQRDLTEEVLEDDCKVLEGNLRSAYSGDEVRFTRGPETSDDVQIDHVVSLSDAWQTGAQQWDDAKRVAFANDVSNLEAVEGTLNQQKGDSNAASWLPPDSNYRCTFVARQILTKDEYGLWVIPAERDAMAQVLDGCQGMVLTVPE